MEKLVIKQLTKEGLNDVQYIINTVFQKKLPLATLEAKYNTKEYCGQEYLATLGYYNNQPIAFYGCVPLRFTNGTTQHLFVQMCDSFTLKEYQGKGIHSRLAKASYEIMKKAGADLVFAMHSENTFYSCKKLNWEVQGVMQLFEIETAVRVPWFKLWCKYPIFQSIRRKTVRKALAPYPTSTEINNDFAEAGFFANDYSKEYVAYKNVMHNEIIEIAGCKVWLKLDFALQIGAFSGLNATNIDVVFKALHAIARKARIQKIIFQLSKDNPTYEVLRSKYPSTDSFKIGYYLFNTDFPIDKVRFNFIELDSFL